MTAWTLFCLLAVSAAPPPAPVLRACFVAEEDYQIFTLAFSADGKTLAAGSFNKTYLWETATWKLRAVLPYDGDSLAFSADGRFLALMERDAAMNISHVIVWDMVAEKPMRFVPPSCLSRCALALSADGKVVAAGGYDGVRVWDVASGAEIFKCCLDDRIEVLAFAPDGRTLAVGESASVISIWNVFNGRKKASLRGHTGELNTLVFTQDGKTLAGAADGVQTITLWNVPSARQLLSFHVTWDDPTGIFHAALRPDGKIVATTSTSGSVKLWDAVRGHELATLTDNDPSWPVAFSPDGTLLAAGVQDKIKVRRFGSGR